MKPNIIKFNSLISYVSEVISYIETAYPAAESLVKEIIRQYKSKINLIDYADSSQN